jgi:DUF1009 family protein
MSASASNYLPEHYDGRPIGLIAGKGRYPELVAERILAAKRALRIVSFADETSENCIQKVPDHAHRQIKVGQLGKLLKSLHALDCGYALMAGQITPRRLFHGLHPDLKALAILNRLKIRNAETIFGAISEEIEAVGMHQLDARCFLDDQLAHAGLMTDGRLSAKMSDIEHGIRSARGVAELDIGQSVVVRKGTVIAVEAYEGTDPMLKRAGEFKTDGLIFVKTVKARQDYRFDVPVFGLRTLQTMQAAGIQTAALQVGGVLMIDKAAVLQEANKLKINLFGYT